MREVYIGIVLCLVFGGGGVIGWWKSLCGVRARTRLCSGGEACLCPVMTTGSLVTLYKIAVRSYTYYNGKICPAK